MSRNLDYVLGFIYGDGSLYKNPTKDTYRLSIYQSEREILDKIATVLNEEFSITPTISSRSRATNMSSKIADEFTLRTGIRKVVDYFMSKGLPAGKKSNVITPPTVAYPLDFLRGYVDADGSVGITKDGVPFVSIVISSDPFKEWVCDLLSGIIGYVPNPSRNSRDSIFNVCVFRENAQALAGALYSGSTIHLSRKYDNYLAMRQWVRPESMRRRTSPFRSWTPEEDAVVLDPALSTGEKLVRLNRSLSSFRNRKFRLLNP